MPDIPRDPTIDEIEDSFEEDNRAPASLMAMDIMVTAPTPTVQGGNSIA